MKRYALYPGVGRRFPGDKLAYIEGRQLAACFRVPYSECLDESVPAIRKVMSLGGMIYLIRLLPNSTGNYTLPSKEQNKLIVVQGLHEAVNKNG